MKFTTYDIISTRKQKRIKIKKPTDLFDILKRYTKAKQEQFIVTTLSGAHEIIAIHIVTVGLVNRTIIHPREVFYHAIHDRATTIIVAHNHPSGNVEPSGEDIEVTEKIKGSSEIIGIPLLDHIIISKKDYYSFKQNGQL
jgi:DNA repair protein RadC